MSEEKKTIGCPNCGYQGCARGEKLCDEIIYRLEQKGATLKQQLAEAVEVLRVYADTGTFCPNAVGSDADLHLCRCGTKHIVGGKRARAFLQKIGGMK